MLKLQFRDKSRPDMWLVDSLISIGSDPANNIVIASDKVAPQHAELRINDNAVEFVHVAPTKSSFVNGSLIASNIKLKAWDIILIGDTELELVDPLINRSPRQPVAPKKTQVREVLSEWLIQAQTAPFSGQLFPVNKPLVIGRDTQCDIAIPMPHISRRHAEVFIENNTLKVRDLGSANGTYINGEKLAQAELVNGDEVRIDEFGFKVIFTGEATEKQQAAFQTTIRATEKKVQAAKNNPPKYPTPPDIGSKTIDVPVAKAFFHGKSKSIRGKVYEVESTGSPIGRMLGHHLSRDDSSVSARHIEIYKNGRFWTVKNNGAANGLLVNGRMTTRATLVEGDEVRIGGMDLIFQCEGKQPKSYQFEQEKPFNIGKIAIGFALVGVAIFIALAVFGAA